MLTNAKFDSNYSIMNINCEILDLRAFLAVFDARSFQRAARTLNISQPALSRRIKALEATLGTLLLNRSTRKVAPTSTGLDLEPSLRRLVEEFDGTVRRLDSLGEATTGQITIASVPTAACYLLPAALREFKSIYPNTCVRILDQSAKDGLDCVQRGEAEFAIGFLGASRPEFRFSPLFDDEFVLACRADHPLAGRKSVRWREILRLPLIVSHLTGNRPIIDEALSKSNLKLNWSYEVMHLSASLSLIEAGLGMAILPRMATPPGEHPIIAAVPLRQPSIRRTIGIVERRDRELSKMAQALCGLLCRPAYRSRPARRVGDK